MLHENKVCVITQDANGPETSAMFLWGDVFWYPGDGERGIRRKAFTIKLGFGKPDAIHRINYLSLEASKVFKKNVKFILMI